MDEKERILSRYEDVRLEKTRSGSRGSWIEWEEEVYIGRGKDDGHWYRIEVYESDVPYKGPPEVTTSTHKLSEDETRALGLARD